MQKNAKIAYLLTGIGLFAITSFAMAIGENPATSSEKKPQMEVQIGPKGNALIHGTVEDIGSGTITVKSWGGNWTINVSGTSIVIPHQTNSSALTDIKTGDFVGVQGKVNADTPWTIDAKLVRDWTSKIAAHTETVTNVKDIRSTERNGHKNGIGKTFEGSASEITATSLTLTAAGGTIYTVSISPDTKLVNRLFRTLSSPTLIQQGDHVRVFGTVSGTVLTAQVVRDTSLPH